MAGRLRFIGVPFCRDWTPIAWFRHPFALTFGGRFSVPSEKTRVNWGFNFNRLNHSRHPVAATMQSASKLCKTACFVDAG